MLLLSLTPLRNNSTVASSRLGMSGALVVLITAALPLVEVRRGSINE
jgi:hypothetical protein